MSLGQFGSEKLFDALRGESARLEELSFAALARGDEAQQQPGPVALEHGLFGFAAIGGRPPGRCAAMEAALAASPGPRQLAGLSGLAGGGGAAWEGRQSGAGFKK